MTEHGAQVHAGGLRRQDQRHKLVLAGSPKRIDVDQFLVLKMLGTVLGSGLVPLGLRPARDERAASESSSTGLLWLLGLRAPRRHGRPPDRRRVSTRSGEQLPEFLDLLTISVEAGLGFDQAVERTSASVPGALSDEFQRMLQEMRIGASRADALRALDDRTDVARAPVVHSRDAAGRHIRCVDRSDPAHAGRRDAGPAAAGRAGARARRRR